MTFTETGVVSRQGMIPILGRKQLLHHKTVKYFLKKLRGMPRLLDYPLVILAELFAEADLKHSGPP